MCQKQKKQNLFVRKTELCAPHIHITMCLTHKSSVYKARQNDGRAMCRAAGVVIIIITQNQLFGT